MSKIRIVFNRSNLDAVCAAAMIITAFRQNQVGCLIDSVPYSVSSYSGPLESTTSFDKTFLIGTFLNSQEILNELGFCKKLFVISHIKPTDKYQPFNPEEIYSLSDNKIHIFSTSFIFGKQLLEVEESYSSCLSKLTKTALASISEELVDSLEKSLTNTSDLTEIMSAVESFIGIKDVSAESILLVHENYDALVESAYTAKAMVFKGPDTIADKIQQDPLNKRKNTIKGINSRIFKARNFIQSSMATQHYKCSKSSIIAQTIQTTEEYLYDVVRQASYPYQIVVVYHDHKNHRHWWIYSGNDAKAQTLVDMIPHVACFNDGEFIHLVSDIPKIEVQ